MVYGGSTVTDLLHVVYNPVAGRGRARRALREVEDTLERWGVASEVHTTERRGHATEIVADLPENARVAVLGGDGTVHEAAAGCIGSERTLCVLPQGSGDDFAHALGLARRDLRRALERAVSGGARVIDTGVVNGRGVATDGDDEDLDAPRNAPFVNSLGSGYDAEVAAAVENAPGFLPGVGAYLWAIGATLGRLEPTGATVTVDDEVVHRGPALLVSVHNGPRTGGSYRFAPDARLDDGVFDVVIAGEVGRLALATLLPRVPGGGHLDDPHVTLHRGREVTIDWDAPRIAHLEGEVLPACERFEATLRPASLRVVGAEDPNA